MSRIKFIPCRRITKSDEELELIEQKRFEQEVYRNSLDHIVMRRTRLIYTREELGIQSSDEEDDSQDAQI